MRRLWAPLHVMQAAADSPSGIATAAAGSKLTAALPKGCIGIKLRFDDSSSGCELQAGGSAAAGAGDIAVVAASLNFAESSARDVCVSCTAQFRSLKAKRKAYIAG